ncbi:MAG: proline reductase cluster protein PrdD [Lachnospiraceae bacterium]|nr:proline reductase cluster protein PrdD [Lachnospiraceae bacterium]
MEEIRKRRLVIKAFHAETVREGTVNRITRTREIEVAPESFAGQADHEMIERIHIRIVHPDQYRERTNSIMDVIPISTKVLGEIGEGVTHTVTGAYVLLTGVDVDGIQTAEFGSSEGVIEKQIAWGKAGTPERGDDLILFEVTFCAGKGQDREAVTRAHILCDEFIRQYRECLKKLRGESCTNRREFYDMERPGKKKVVIIKQVAGQGAMYDMQLFAKEPSGMSGGRSIIDMGNMPIVVTPNEYRDGILRSMQ